jgi:hypothetical protein
MTSRAIARAHVAPALRVALAAALGLAPAAGCGDGDGDGDDAPEADASSATDGAAEPGPDAAAATPRVLGYVRAAPYPRLAFEIDSVPGFEPRDAVAADLAAMLESLLDKPAGVDAVADQALASRGGDHAWTEAELRDLADETFDLDVAADTTKIHALFVDGHSARDDAGGGVILGIAWANTHLVIFKQTIETMCAGRTTLPPLLRDQLCSGGELAIWTHEVGHVIGLVDNGLPMVADHADRAHGAHDVDDGCVMYWSYDGEAVLDTLEAQLLGGGAAGLAFDDACIADIDAAKTTR